MDDLIELKKSAEQVIARLEARIHELEERMGRVLKFVRYDNEWNSACAGAVVFSIGDTEYKCNEHCLSSGGSLTSDEDYNFTCKEGPWSWTYGAFDTDELRALELTDNEKDALLAQVNVQVPWGCCGACSQEIT